MEFKDINSSFGQLSSINLYMHKPEDVIKTMRENGIVSWAFTSNASIKDDVMRCNTELVSQCKGIDGAIPAVTLLPPVFKEEAYTRGELLDLIAKTGRIVFRMFPKRHSYIFADWQLGWLAEVLEETGIPVLIHLEDIDVKELAEFKKIYKNTRIILTNTTQWMNRIYLQLCKTFKNIYIDTSNMIEFKGIEEFTGEIGSDRIVFGTNIPYKEPYDNILMLLYAKLTEEEKQNIAFRNFDRLTEGRV